MRMTFILSRIVSDSNRRLKLGIRDAQGSVRQLMNPPMCWQTKPFNTV